MAGNALSEIDFTRHYRRFARSLGEQHLLGACDAQGRTLWTSDGGTESHTARIIEQLNRDGFVWKCNGSGYTHHVLDPSNEVIGVPIAADDEGHAPAEAPGWLVLLGAPDEEAALAVPARDQTVQVLREFAGALHDELSLRGELDALARELGERYEELHLVYNMDTHLKNFTRGWEAFKGLVDLSARHLSADVAAFVTAHQHGTVWATALSKPIFNLDLVLVELGGDLFRFVQAGRETVVINEPDDPRRPYVFTDMPYKVLACPMFDGHAVNAILALIRHLDRDDFSASDRKLAQVIANQFGNLMHLSQAMDEVNSFNEQMAGALIESVEAKDPYTRGHSERVRDISRDIGVALGLRDPALSNLVWSALLHDVGKIGIPDAVLCKPGKLSRDEFTFIKVHPTRGGDILSHIGRLADSLPGVRHHHERMDGKGYPEGLAGNAIPLQARIIAVADTYDSITSSRAYRPGRGHDEAIAEIQRVAGPQLDPEIVSAFLKACEAAPAWLRNASNAQKVQHG